MAQSQLLELIFSQDGLLSRSLKNFEERTGQQEMAKTILDAYEEDKIALIEAGTGIGKSLAYLVPAVYWALKNQEKTVITTHTIALQEQLLHKDIPFLLKIMDLDLKACLVKGMGNYLCLRKLHELQDQPLLFSVEETKEVQAIEEWSEKTKEGSRSDIAFPVSPASWEKVAAEGESCNRNQCPHYKDCFFFKARKEAEESQFLIVNHHLLLADIERKRLNPGQESILPEYNRLIVDEAHHLEEIALESFAARFERISFLKQLGKLHSETHPERSRLALLKKNLTQTSPTVMHKLDVEIPAQKRKCHDELEKLCAQISFFLEKETRKRISDSVTAHPFWQGTILPSLQTLSDEIEQLSVAINGLVSDVEGGSASVLELQAMATRLSENAEFLNQFALDEPKEKRVRWIDISGHQVTLVDAALDISKLLNEHLFSKQRTSVLCSATIAPSRSFTFLKQRLGLTAENIEEKIFDSPFNYAERTLFVVPTDLSPPSSPDFITECADAMAEAIEISRGSTFLLFTSYDMLQNCYRILSQTSLPGRFPFLKQGDLPRHVLLEKFKGKEGSILFATDSFWEGVDVPGEALRCVIIAKLPFSVPSDPLYQAYAESLEKEGLDPFFDYSVPQAVIKFKQGFGRLMRKNDDRGCILCLDHRIVKKNYGKHFLKSLPPATTCFAPKQEVYDAMRRFYHKTR